MKTHEKPQSTQRRDSAAYVLNFIVIGTVAFGTVAMAIGLIYSFSIVISVVGGIVMGAAVLSVVGAVLDVRKEMKYRNNIREEVQKDMEAEGIELMLDA